MTLNNYFTIPTHDFDDRPKPKVWLLKPDFTRIERLTGVSKLNGTFKANNLNTLTGQISPTVFDSVSHKQKRNPVFDLIRNKYLIEFHYNGFKDYFVIDDIKNVSSDSDNITFSAESLSSELNKKAANEIEMLGSPIKVIMDKVLAAYAPLWSVDHVDAKLAEVKRELTMTSTTVMGIIDELNKLFDSVVVFNNKDRKISFFHKDNVGVNRGLRIRENSYLKSFEDSLVSKDIITRLYPFGNSGLTIQSVNPAGTDYIEDFSYFMSPFKRDAQKKVLQHSDYMSDDLCHALLDYQEFFEGKKDLAEEYTKRYSDILKEYTQEAFSLNQLSATLQHLQDRVEILKPKSEYIELGNYTSNFDFYTPKSSYYLLMIQNKGNLTNIKFGGKSYDVPANDWLYIKFKTGEFQDAEKFEEKLKHSVEVVSSNVSLRAILTRSSESDFEEDTDKDNKYLEQKYNLPKYEELVYDQTKIVNAIEKRMKIYEDEKASLIRSMNPKLFLSDELYKERESYIFAGIWTEENHTEAKDLFEDALKQMKKQKEINRSVTVGLINFTQSLEHKRDWDKLNVGDVIVFSNKIFNKKLKAYITDIQINFEDNQVTITVSDVIDYVDESKKVAELIATASSTSSTVNFHKEQIKQQQGKMTAMTQLIEAEWDANKKRIMAGNETVDIGAHGIKVVSNNNPDEYVAIVGGVIALTRDGGNTFKTGVTPEGVNAETLIGKIFIGENLELQNESGTVKFNKNGFTADVSSFTLTTNDGKEDYFEKLKKDMREESKTELDRLRNTLEMKINEANEEAQDVQALIDGAIVNFQEAFKDGIVSDVEKKMIQETLAQLEKENSEYVHEIEKALSHPYITSDDIILLNEQRESYESMYHVLVEDINDSISDDIITAEESEKINQAIVNFREGIQEVLSLLKEIMNRTLENQIATVKNEAYKYADRMSDDIKDEMSDLKKAMDKANETIESAMKDNVFDIVETENIKTMLAILKSEQEDIMNRYTSVYSNPHLSAEYQASLKLKKDNLLSKYNEYSKYVNDMIADGKSDDTERVNYQLKYKNLTDAQTDFFTEYDNAVIAISKSYTDTREGQLNANIDGLRTEFNNDLKDIKDNMTELVDTINDTFEDGIITATELNRLIVHLDMLDREYLDIDERYKELSSNAFLPEDNKVALGRTRTPYVSAHSDLRNVIKIVIDDNVVENVEKNAVNTRISTYNRTFADFSKAIQTALNVVARNVASDIANEKVKSFNPVLESISTNITAIQKQVDSAIDTYYYGYDPTLSNIPSSEWVDSKTKEQHIGDLFLNTKTGIAYRFLKNGSVYQWQRIEDQAISDALNKSQGAMDLADNKRRVFVSTPTPPYDVGDLWMQGVNGDAMVCFTSKTASQVYETSDWVKAVKYTDDSKANAVLSELNSFKSTTSTDIINLKSQTDLFKKDIYDAFDDKVISMSEASAIKSRFYQVLEVKKRLENKYFTLVANSDLFGNAKSNLTTQYNNLLTAYNSLETTINSAISDNKITDTENKNTKVAFDNFLVAIQNIEKAFDEAFTAIISNIATAKAQLVQDRFDTWKNTEFTTTSEGIVQRVSEANWRDKYLPEVDNRINSISVGGRNLLRYSTQQYYQTPTTYNGFITNHLGKRCLAFNNSNNIFSIQRQFNVLESGQTYTFSFYAAASEELNMRNVYLNPDNNGFIPNSTIGIEWKRYSFTFTPTTEQSDVVVHMYPSIKNNDGTYKTFYLADWQLEKGTVATDVKPAIEDTTIDVTQLKTDITSSTNSYAKAQADLAKAQANAYADGKVTASEQKTLDDAVAKLNTAKAYADEKNLEALKAIQDIQVGGTNLTLDSLNNVVFSPNNVGLGIAKQNSDKSWTITPDSDKIVSTYYFFKRKDKEITSQELVKDTYYTISLDVTPSVNMTVELGINNVNTPQYNSTEKYAYYELLANKSKRIHFTFKILNDLDSIPIILRNNSSNLGATITYTNFQLEVGNMPTPWSPSIADTYALIAKAQTDSIEASKAYAVAQDTLLKVQTNAYADGKISTEEKRAIADANSKLETAKSYADTKKKEALAALDNLQIGGRNLLQSSNKNFPLYINKDVTSTGSFTTSGFATNLYRTEFLQTILKPGETYTYSYDIEIIELAEQSVPISGSHGIIFYSNSNANDRIFSYNQLPREVGQKNRVVQTFVCPQITDHRFVIYSGLYSNNGVNSPPTSSNKIRITNLKLEKGNKATDWTPAPEDVENKLVEQGTKIDSTTSFIEQNKDKIASSVTKAEVEGQFAKVATNQNSYTISTTTGEVLTEFYGSPFSDNYTYEVTAKNTSMTSDNVASAVFVSKGVNKGFELVELENKGTTGVNPKFELNSKGQPVINVYSLTGTQNIEVIYTKYMGSSSTINTAKSMIDQRADQINLEVSKINDSLTPNNLLTNTDFANKFDGWSEVNDVYTITNTEIRALNTDSNLITNGESMSRMIGVGGAYQRVTFKLSKELEIGKTYTLAFDYQLLSGSNPSGTVDVLPYFYPTSADTGNNVISSPVYSNKRNYITFKNTERTNEVLIYCGTRGTEAVKTAKPLYERVTLTEGTEPLVWKNNSVNNILTMSYTSNYSYPFIASDYIPVGDDTELKVGDVVTFSTYIYVPDFAKSAITGYPYFELCGYDNIKQSANAYFGRFELSPSNFVYNRWVRYEFTTTIPSTTSNGKVNYIRALLRFHAINQTVNSDCTFYYGMPQLEKGSKSTPWSLSKEDELTSKRMASKITLNPDSIDMISNNLRINTDNVVISNTEGNFTMKKDTFSVANSSGSNIVNISSNGINIKKDGVDKMIDGLDTGSTGIYPFQPRYASYSKYTTGTYGGLHVKEPNNDNYMNFYQYGMGERDIGTSDGSLVGLKKDCGRINRYMYYHDRRYLKIQLYYSANNMTGFFHVTNQSELTEFSVERLPDTKGKKEYVTIIADIGKPTNKFKNLELSIGATGGSVRATDNVQITIMLMQLLNFNS